MADIMEFVRAARERRGKESRRSKQSPPAAPVPTPSPASLAFLPGPIPVAHRDARPVTRPVTLHSPIPWNQQEVSKRTRAADELVARLHVDGRDPEVQRAAAMVVSATATRDMEVLVYALAEFNLTVRRVEGKKFVALA